MKNGKQTEKQCRKNQILIWKWNLINSNPMDNYLSCLIKKYMYLTLFKNPYLEWEISFSSTQLVGMNL